MILLDTNVLFHPPSAWPDDSLGASMICLAELHFGVQVTTDLKARAERTRRLSKLRDTFDWIPFDEYAAESYGVLTAEVSRTRPGHARSKDIMIAAQAHSLGVPLLTRNVKNFELVSHLVEIVDAEPAPA